MKKLNYSESFLNDVITKNFKPIHGALFKGLCVSLLLIFSSGLFAQTITCPSNVTVDAEAGLCGAIVNYDVTATPGGGGPSSIPLEDFEGPTFPALSSANGAPLPTILPDPTPGATNGTDVLSIISNSAGQPWQQAELELQSGFELDLTGTDKRVSVDWYSIPAFSAFIRIDNRISGTVAAGTAEVAHPGGGWATLVFDFSTQAQPSQTGPIPPDGIYRDIYFFNHWDIASGDFLNPFTATTTYVDNITKGVVVPFSEDFEGPTFPALSSANGAPLPTILPDPTPGATNGTDVLSIISNSAGQPWQQAELELQSGFELDLTGTDKRVSVDWYSIPAFSAFIRIDNRISGTVAAGTAEVAHPGGGWATLVFDFSTQAQPSQTGPIPPDGIYRDIYFFNHWDIASGDFLNPFTATTTYVDNIREGAEDATVTIVSTPPSGSVFNVGTTTVTSIATDGSGSTATCSFDVTVVDNEALSIDCNVAGPQNALTNSSFENNNGFNTQGATDWAQFGPVFILDQNFVGTAQDGDFFLKMFSGNAGLFQDIPVTAGDNITGSVYMQNASFDPTGPVGGGQIKLEWIGAGGVVTSDTFTNANPQDVWTKVSVNAVVPAGATGVRFVVICNLPAGGAIMYDNASLINNSQPPSGLVGDVSVSNDPGACGANLELATPATTSCQVTITNDYNGTSNASGFYPIGVTPVTWTVTNSQGQTASCSVNITVEDTETPTLDCSQGANSGNVLVNNSFENGAVFNAPFNTDWNTFGFAPLFAIDANIIPFAQDGNFYLKAFTSNAGLFQEHPVAAGDIIDASIYIGNLGFDPIQPGCEAYIKLEYNNGDVVESIRLDNSLPVNTWNQISLSDVAPAGATSVKYVAVMGCPGAGAVMFDNASMIITGAGLVGNVEVDNDPGACGAQLSLAVPSNGDNCGAILTNDFNGTGDASDFYPVGTTTVTWTITDAQNLSTSCTIDVTVTDAEAPNAIAQNVTVTLDAAGNGTLTATEVDNGSNDNCTDPVSLSIDNTSFTCADIAAPAVTGDLFISEYIEGGGNNKCLEIYNGTGAAIDLAAGNYSIARYANGTTTPTNISLTGTVADGDVYVICTSSSTLNAGMAAQADQFNGNISHNGDDAYALRNNGTIIDVFGKIGQDPGSEWSQGGNTTANNTLIRNSSVLAGNTDDLLNFPSLATEWAQFAQDYSDDLGSHTIDSGGGGQTVTLTVTDANGNSSTATASVTVVDDTPPTIVCNGITVELDANGSYTLSEADIDTIALGSDDTCGIASVSVSQNTFSCDDVSIQGEELEDYSVVGDGRSAAYFNFFGQTFVAGQSGELVRIENLTLQAQSQTNTPINSIVEIIEGNDPQGTNVLAQASLVATSVFTTFNIEFTNSATLIAGQSYTLVLRAENEANAGGRIIPLAALDPFPDGELYVSRTSTSTLDMQFTTIVSTGSDNAVTLTVTDINGNVSTCSFDVIVTDNEVPVISCLSPTVSLDANGEATISIADVFGGATDNCDIDLTSVTISDNSFDCSDLVPVSADPANSLIISGVYDGPLSGGQPKGVELYVAEDIADLSQYGLGGANNGGGTDGQEFTFPAVSATAGTYIYVANEAIQFANFFGFVPDYTTFAMAINGDDAIELFYSGSVVDVFGDINVDGSGQPWEYLDGWAYRNSNTGPDGSTFMIANWSFSGTNVFDGQSTNNTSPTPFPIGSFNAPDPANSLIISGVYDGPLTGGTPKGVELYAASDIADLSEYGLGSANNGGGSDGQEFTFPAVAVAAGTHIYVANEAIQFANFFGFAPDYTTGFMAINGDDAIELFYDSSVTDTYGDINVDGNGDPWEYLDSWAYRIAGGPDAVFNLANWSFGGPNAFDGETTNATAATPMPIGSFSVGGPSGTAVPVMVSVTDVNGNVASCIAMVTVIDDTDPTISCPGNFVEDTAPGACGTVITYNVAASDNCSGEILEQTEGLPSGSEFPIGTTTNTFVVTDSSGNTSTCSFDVIISDNEDPVAICPGDITVNNDEGDCGADVDFALLATDNCSFTAMVISGVIDGPLSGGTPKAIEFKVLYDIPDLSAYGFGSANNGNGGGNQEYTFSGSASAGDYIYIASETGQFNTFLGFAPNDTSGAASINGDDAIELFYNGGVIDVFGDINVDGSNQPWEYLDGWAYRNDNTGPDGSTFTIGNWTFSGRNALDGETSNATAATPFPVGTFETNVGGSIVSSHEPGSFFEVGTTAVTITATDAAGNTNECTFNVTVNDTEAPVVACNEITIVLDGNGEVNLDASDLDNMSSDNCGGPLTFTIDGESSADFSCADTGGDLDQLIISEYIDGAGANDCIEIYNGTGNPVELTGNYSIAVYADGSTTPTDIWPLLGTIAADNTYVVCQQFSDASGVDLVNGLTLTGNDAVALQDNGNAVDIIGIIGSDPGTGWSAGANQTNNRTLVRNNDVFAGDISNANAGLASEWTSYPSTNMSGLGSHDIETVGLANNVILTVTDIYGNSSTCEAAVTVVDDTPPLAVAQDVVVQLDASGNGSTSAVLVNDGSSDVCGIALLELNQTDFTCANVGVPNPVILTVTDVNGNTATAPANVTVIDGVAPNAITQDAVVVLDANGNGSITVADINNGSNDACGIATITVSPSTFDCSNVGDNVVTLTVTDVNGNVSTATANVEVQDNTNPTAVCQAYTVTLDATGSATITPADVDGGSEDACGILNYEIDIDTFGCDDLGDNDVVLTVTDNNGNSSSCTAVVTVEGDLPVVDITEAVLPGLCQGDFVLLTANSDLGVAWEWFLDGVATGDTTETIEASEDGVYTVDVTSATNCTTAASYTVTGFDLGGLISAYTIVAQDWVYLHGDNLVGSGGVGAMDPGTGNIKLHQTSNVVGFAQAATFNIQAGSTIGTQVIAPANPIIPAFESNTQSNAGSPNVTVNNNATQNLNGSVYGTITIKQGATVTFTQANVYINEIKTFKDATIEFAGCTNLYINEKFQLAEDGVINSAGNYVTMYVNDDVQIERGSDVRARIHAGDNAMLVKGANGNSTDVTYMTGLFIADTVHGSNEIIWNQDPLCDPCPVDQPLTNPTNDTENTENSASREAFDVKAWPNPSNTTFNVQLVSQNVEDNATIYVFDMNNKLVHTTEFGAEDKYNFGSNLEGGVYIVKVVQGKNMKYVRLVKY